MNEEYLRSHVDPHIVDAVIECNRKGLVTADACAGIGKGCSMSGRVYSKYHSRECLPYVTFVQEKCDKEAFQKLSDKLKSYMIDTPPFAEAEPLFEVISYPKDSSMNPETRKINNIPPKHRIGMPFAFLIPLKIDNIAEDGKYLNKFYALKKKWHKLFYQTVKEL